jgi:hypothetical protein
MYAPAWISGTPTNEVRYGEVRGADDERVLGKARRVDDRADDDRDGAL